MVVFNSKSPRSTPTLVLIAERVLFWVTLRMAHKMSLCTEFPLLVAIPLCLLWLVFVLVFVFVFLFCFVLLLMGLPLDCVLSTTSSFVAAYSIDSLASNYYSACLLRMNVCNDLAEAMKALDGKKVLIAERVDIDNVTVITKS